ncbi:hypothetical protein BDV12DRAFT_205598 [Aspergillus spectabilis]
MRARRDLRKHISLGPELGNPPCPDLPEVLRVFFIKIALYSHKGLKCKLLTCDQRIQPGSLCFAVSPGIGQNKWSTADYYHIWCFEVIADFSASSILDTNYLVPGGLERLILEWKVRCGEQVDRRDGPVDRTNKGLDLDLSDLLQRAGSATYEYHNLLSTLAPYEKSLADPHNLSAMLKHWETDVIRCLSFIISSLTSPLETCYGQRSDLKATRALKRLSGILIP